MKKKLFTSAALLMVIYFILACQAGGISSTGTPVAPQDTPSPTTVPLEMVFSSEAWRDVEIDSLCINIDAGSNDGIATGVLSNVFDINNIKSLLTDIGLKTGEGTSGCDATLNLVVGYTTSATTYVDQNGGGTSIDCVTGVYLYGLMILTTPQHPPLYSEMEGEVVNEPIVITDGCPDLETTAKAGWYRALLAGLSDLLGPGMISSLLESSNTDHRTAALLATESLGPQDLQILPQVVEALKTQADFSNVVQISTGIQNMGPQAQQAASEAVPLLIEQVEPSGGNDIPGFPFGMFQQPYIEAFGRLGPGAEPAVPLLVQMLKDEATDDFIRDVIVQTLGEIGPAAAEAVPQLQALVDVNLYAEDSLEKIQPSTPDFDELMAEALDFKTDPFGASNAMEMLGSLNAGSPDILPFLLLASKDSDPNVASNAMQALGKLGPISPDILPVLKSGLSSSNETIQTGAAQGLGDFGPAGAEAIPQLINVIQNGSQYSLAQSAAVEALGHMGQTSPEVISALTFAVENYISGAPQAIEQLGPAARPTVPALIKALEGENVNPYLFGIQTPLVRALISVTGEYHGFHASDWQTWWDAQPQ